MSSTITEPAVEPLVTSECSSQSLLTSFTDTTFQYDQIERQGNIALFEQTHKQSGIVRYEVVVIETKPAQTLPSGKSYPEREVSPSSGSWGQKGWTMYTTEGAREKIRWLQHPLTEDRTDAVERDTWKKRHPGRERT